jgi:hypothetical protein
MKQKNDSSTTPGQLTVRITPRDGKKPKPKKRITKKQLQPPFREQDLLTTDAFIRYCGDYGIKTDKDELEYFEKEALLLPAVRVFLGAVEFKRILADFDGKKEWRYVLKRDMRKLRSRYKVKKIDGKTYYKYGVISMGEDGWLERYVKMGLVKCPARQKVRPWKHYELKHFGYTTDWRVFENAAEALYSRLQMYVLPLIQTRLRLLVKNESLYGSEEDWISLGQSVARILDRDKTAESIRQIIRRHYKFFGLLVDIEDLWGRYVGDLDRELSEEVQQQIKEGRGDQEELTDEVVRMWQSQKTLLDEYLMDDAEALLSKHGFSRKEVEKWRFAFLGYGTLILKRPLVRKYLMKIDDADLMATEDPYRLYGLVNWFIRLCGGKPVGIREAIMRFTGKFCPYCGGPIPKPKKNQVSCGRDECKRSHRLKLQRAGYRSGKY